MKKALCILDVFAFITCAQGQTTGIQALIANRGEAARQVTVVKVAAHFVTAIRVPEAVTSVAVGDPALFQAEHSDHEPQFVFVKVLTTKPAETNLLISTAKGHEICMLLISKGEAGQPAADFLVNYRPERSFVVDPSSLTPGISQTVGTASAPTVEGITVSANSPPMSKIGSVDPSHSLPLRFRINFTHSMTFWSARNMRPCRSFTINIPNQNGRRGADSGRRERSDRWRRRRDRSVFRGESADHAILLLPPQVQLGGETRQGKLIKHSRWTSAEQLPVIAYRLSRRAWGPPNGRTAYNLRAPTLQTVE